MSVESKIKSVADTFQGEGVSYYFGDWARANKAFDNMSLPAIVYVMPASGEIDLSAGNVRDKENALIAFLDKTTFDFEATENNVIVESMKALAMRFFVACNNSRLFEPIGGKLPYRVVYDMLDVNVTGITFELPIKEVTGKCIKGL